jgi:hypothetical protein
LFLEAEQSQNNYRLDVPVNYRILRASVASPECIPNQNFTTTLKKRGEKGKFLAHVLGINLGAKRKPNAGKTHGHANWDKFLSRRWMQMNAQASPAA